MKKVISKNKFFSAICAFGLVLMLGCAMMLSACATYTTGELKLAKGEIFGVDLDSTELTLTAVQPATGYDYGIKVTGAVTEVSATDFGAGKLGFTEANTKGRLVVLFTLTITEEMMADEDAVIKLDKTGTLDKEVSLQAEGAVDVLPSYGHDGFIVIVLNTAGDGISHVALQWTPEGADKATVVKYVIDFTGIEKATTPAA